MVFIRRDWGGVSREFLALGVGENVRRRVEGEVAAVCVLRVSMLFVIHSGASVSEWVLVFLLWFDANGVTVWIPSVKVFNAEVSALVFQKGLRDVGLQAVDGVGKVGLVVGEGIFVFVVLVLSDGALGSVVRKDVEGSVVLEVGMELEPSLYSFGWVGGVSMARNPDNVKEVWRGVADNCCNSCPDVAVGLDVGVSPLEEGVHVVADPLTVGDYACWACRSVYYV